MPTLPRGIAPDLLLSQVKNTMPYLFESEEGATLARGFPPAEWMRASENLLSASDSSPSSLSHFEYFRLCLSAHYLTVGTPVPTDVDNQIRLKLWPKKLPLETALEMADLVLPSRKWDFSRVSPRFACGSKGTPWENEPVSGHLGEWFTVASGAYCALRQYNDPAAEKKRQEFLAAIADEVNRHSEIFGSLWRSGDGLGALKASASLAHNFGDLDRVMDMWELPIDDPLRLQFYKLGTTPFDPNGKLRYLGRLWVAGELYKSPIAESAMAFENHRHFALRKPKALRRERAFLIPTGPFFDDWGRTLATHLTEASAPSPDLLEIIEALKHGWERLPRTVGYGRALRGIVEIHPDLREQVLPGDFKKFPHHRSALEISQKDFERTWSEEALKLMDDIPSRA